MDIGSGGKAVLETLQALLLRSVSDAQPLSQHPASVGARFRLLLLALKHANHLQVRLSPHSTLTRSLSTSTYSMQFTNAEISVGCLQDTNAKDEAAKLHSSVLTSALMWYSNPVAYFGGWTAAEARWAAD